MALSLSRSPLNDTRYDVDVDVSTRKPEFSASALLSTSSDDIGPIESHQDAPEYRGSIQNSTVPYKIIAHEIEKLGESHRGGGRDVLVPSKSCLTRTVIVTVTRDKR